MIQKVEGGVPTAATPIPDSQNGVVQESGWYWDENVPGVGARPEWLKEKYGKVVDQAKAYIDAEKRLGASDTVAPDEYELSDYSESLDLENPHIVDLKNKAKELRLSQEALKNLIDPIVKYQQSLLPNVDEEIKKLGDHAQTRINTVNTWATNHLSEKAVETLGKISHTADVVELIDEIRQLHFQTQSRVPTGNQGQQKIVMVTAESVQNEIVQNYARYQNEPAYRMELQNKLKQALGED